MFNQGFKPELVLAAAKDVIARSAGQHVRDPHPVSTQLNVADVALACGLQARPNGSALDQRVSIMGFGIHTGTFQRLVSDALRIVVSRTYVAQAQHLIFAQEVLIKKLGEPVPVLGGVDSAVELLPVGELGVIERFSAAGAFPGLPEAQLARFGRIVEVTRRAVVNDDLREVTNAMSGLGAGAGRKEAQLVCEAFESNPTMDDGTAFFDATRNNIEAGALDATTLGSALAKLRKQTLPNGERSDLAGRLLVVCAELELKARQEVTDAGIDLQVIPMAHLPAARWYLLADPLIQPTIGVLRMPGVKDPTRVDPAPKSALFHVDGTGVRVLADLGACLLSPVGIVRGGTVAEE